MKTMKITLSMLLLSGGLFNTQQCKAQQAGDIDVNWATNGWLMDDHVANEGEIFTSIKKISNDRFMMVGHSNDANMNMLLAMYNSDGTLDVSFGNQGVLKIDLSIGANDASFDIVELWDGKILVAGSTTGAQSVELVVLRLLADGQIDNSFGTAGQVRYDAGPGSWSIPSTIAVSASNNIFIGAGINTGVSFDFSVIKLTQGGGFAANFGTNGVATILENASNDRLKAMHITATEEVIFAGNINYGGSQSGILAKLDVNGDLDVNFNTLGYVEYSSSQMNYFNDLIIDDLGSILVTGHEGNGDDVDGIVIKYVSDGTLDLTFATNGMITIDIGAANGIYYHNIDRQADGGYIVTGKAYGQSLEQIHAFTFDANGSPDCEFSCGGVYHDFTIQIVDMEQTLLEVLDDGSIITGGYITSPDFIGENMYLVKILNENELVSIDNIKTEENSISVYPNPTNGNFNILNKNQDKLQSIHLISFEGRIIQTWEDEQISYELPQGITNGTYLVQITTSEGTLTKKLVVNK